MFVHFWNWTHFVGISHCPRLRTAVTAALTRVVKNAKSVNTIAHPSALGLVPWILGRVEELYADCGTWLCQYTWTIEQNLKSAHYFWALSKLCFRRTHKDAPMYLSTMAYGSLRRYARQRYSVGLAESCTVLILVLLQLLSMSQVSSAGMFSKLALIRTSQQQ